MEENDETMCISDNSLEIMNKQKDKVQMPVLWGNIDGFRVKTLRDSGCSGVIVRKNLVSEDEFTSEVKALKMVDNSIVYAPMAYINVKSPFFTGRTKCMCLDNPVYDLIIGNIPGARNPDDPDITWEASSGQIEENDFVNIWTKEDLRKAQEEDSELMNLKEKRKEYFVNNGIIYRECY